MKKFIMLLFLCVSLQIHAQIENKFINAYGAWNFQLDSFGMGLQVRSKISDKFYISNDYIFLFNDEYEVDKMINIDANLQYVFTYSQSEKIYYYPFIGVGWSNYKTEYLMDFYGDYEKDIESPVKGSYIFLNLGFGGTCNFSDNIYLSMEYKWATSHGRIHSTWLLGIGIRL